MSDNIKDLMMELEIATISAHDESRPIPAGAMDKLEAARDALRAAIAEKDAEIVRLKEELDATNNRAMRYAITIAELRDRIDEYTSHRKQEE